MSKIFFSTACARNEAVARNEQTSTPSFTLWTKTPDASINSHCSEDSRGMQSKEQTQDMQVSLEPGANLQFPRLHFKPMLPLMLFQKFFGRQHHITLPTLVLSLVCFHMVLESTFINRRKFTLSAVQL